VLEDGVIRHPDLGTPQGGVISPILANIYLHEVLDKWFEDMVKPRLGSVAFLIRYADDAIMGFTSKGDAERVLAVLHKRFVKFGLTLHPEKTRLIRFTRPGPFSRKGDKLHPGTFNFLGFTIFWGKAYSGVWVVRYKTAKDRFTRAVERISTWCKVNRHLSLKEQQRSLALRLKGHDQYYGVTGNWPALCRFHFEVRRIWHKWLSRRSQRGNLNWTQFQCLSKHYPLPSPKVVHSSLTM